MRLIDADLLKRKAVNFCIEDDDILNLIDETPSAYDTDKVVEQLEKRIKDAEKVIVKNPADKLDEIANETSEAFIEAYKDAIEIVKGVEQMSDIELKPCPFCGGKPEYKEFHDDNGGVERYYREWSHYIIECE